MAMKSYLGEVAIFLLALTFIWSGAHALKQQRGDITIVAEESPVEFGVSKSRTSRQTHYQQQPQFTPQYAQCIPPPPPFEGKACTHTSECDGSNTVLSCERGACTCPKRPTMKWIRGPYELNTAWDPELKKCVSVKDSACDIYKPKTVHCQKGLICHEKHKNYGFGLCSTSAAARSAVVYNFVGTINMKIMALTSFSLGIVVYSFI